ncbi:MAG: putative ATP-dependent helicase DinG [Elusimicrobia bacterium ADurb.Bin231]|nr:MAG: putative ATP-dependent helicase DinG [Elusimicrobia bacterium ADurb.Bin231]
MDIDFEKIYSPDGCLGQHLKDYEYRPQQVAMAQAVAEAIKEKRHLIAEAGTGVGKTFAYLAPAIYYSAHNKKRTVISTFTKTLQHQLAEKDIPFLKTLLGIDFKFSLCLGAENYVCLRRLEKTYKHSLFNSLETQTKILAWAKESKKGLRAEIDFDVDDDTWHEVCREPDLCMGRKCLYRNKCFYNKARIEQFSSDILIVNHYLFFANIASGKRLLPKYSAVIFDEAQNLESVASEYLGIEISNTSFSYFLNRIQSLVKRAGIQHGDSSGSSEEDNFFVTISHLKRQANVFFNSVLTKVGVEQTLRLKSPGFLENNMSASIQSLAKILEELARNASDEDIKLEISGYALRLKSLKKNIESFLSQDIPDYVYWIETGILRKIYKIILRAAPVDVSSLIKEDVFDSTDTVVLTSATLSADQKFDFIKTRLGLDTADELILDSPFNYEKQVLLYLPGDMPDPREETNLFFQKITEEIHNIIQFTCGRTFCLFTSFKMLNFAADYLSGIKGFNIFKQGNSAKWKMLEEFKRSDNAVLLGTSTFWQGIDVPGRALECVIITKLPFSVPDEPLTEAKIELIKNRGGNPFRELQLPQAIIMLKQGFGRLIRHKKDIGIVAVLDSRIRTRGYGKKFLRSLPGCRIVEQLNDLKQFYEEFYSGGKVIFPR